MSGSRRQTRVINDEVANPAWSCNGSERIGTSYHKRWTPTGSQDATFSRRRFYDANKPGYQGRAEGVGQGSVLKNTAPAVSNAIQGAYFVAAVVTGIIFGIGAIVFTEVTEGLGCLLGGYCLSMWFLTLRPGGLLRSTTQKAIFIAAFSLGVYALSFSRFTRPYGLIGSTSFAGASAVILGIDCFSRAGLKEFCMYLWCKYT